MMSCSKDDRLWWGLVAFVVGAIVLLTRFGVVPAETWDYLWPSILVVSGIKWMLSGNGGSCCSSEACDMACDTMCKDCKSMECTCEAMPMAKKAVAKKGKSKRK